jgi:hypothetical protein
MIPGRKVMEYVAAEPFQPFRIKMASGQPFEIRHPEMIMVGRTTARVYTSLDTESGDGERWHELSVLLIESLEPIEPAPARTGEGSNG